MHWHLKKKKKIKKNTLSIQKKNWDTMNNNLKPAKNYDDDDWWIYKNIFKWSGLSKLNLCLSNNTLIFKVTKGLRFVSGVLRIRLFFPSVYVLLLNWLLNVKQKSGMDICWLHTAGMINSFKKKKENQKCLVEGSEREKDRNVLNLGHALKPWTWPIIHMDNTHACC